MKTVLVMVAVVWGGSAAVLAQNLSVRGKNADEEWRELRALVSAAPSPLTGVRNTAVVRAEAEAKALAARQLAQRAREFRTGFPDHKDAPEASKIEALASLRGVMMNDSVHEAQAKETAKTYREDVRNRLGDRIEVAVLAERTSARAKFGGAVYANNGPELELMADRLRKEFGDVQEIFDLYLTVARSSDMNTARSIAVKLLQASANPTIKKEAQSIVDRHSFLGRPPNVPLRLQDGADVPLTQAGAKPTVLFFWPASGPKLSHRLMKALPRNARILHVMPGASAAEFEAAKRTAQVPGTFCLDSSPAGSVGGDLAVRHLPYVFAIDPAGKLTGYGPISAAESTFHSISR
jgi:hypothetical protein